MDTPTPQDLVVLRSRLEPIFPEGLDERGREIATKYLAEIDGLQVEKVAILLAFEHVMVDQLSRVVQDLDKKAKGDTVSKIVKAVHMPPRKRF